ncbi:MAG TPA: VTT domain-containing protein [Candidatus Solibacter sp.]|nr:VTT domain-containing protein [Candidatus Solibacter sp.]
MAAAVLGRQACLPVPANLLIVAAGALARTGELHLMAVILSAVLALVLADLVWYEAGRRWGERTLHLFYALSHDPAASASRAKTAFARHGVRTLLVSKFIIGLDAVAVPLTGASGIPAARFVVFEAAGATLWTASYAALGYIFSDQLDRVAVHLARLGVVLGILAAAAVVLYFIKRTVRWLRFVRQFALERITVDDLERRLKAGEDILLLDLQGDVANREEAPAIPGAVRIDPRRLERYKDVEIPASREVVLYCASAGEFTSARVALALRERGILGVRPLAGGIQEWQARGFPTTINVPLGSPFPSGVLR